jgi:uncharacterized protein YjbI with pentapeptide repeats
MTWRSLPWHTLIRWVGLLVAVACGVAIIVVLFGPVTDLIARHDVSSITGLRRVTALQSARDAARGRLLQLGAGLFAAAALIYTARNFTLSREGQVTDRYTKAIEQLGSDKLDVRIGGIYALERVARDSARDHSTVIEVLAAFVREHSHEPWPLPAGNRQGSDPSKRLTRPDVQAALTVIGRRNPRHDKQPVNLFAANLTHADLIGGNFARAMLSDAILVKARLHNADLTGAHLVRADLTGAVLVGVDLTGAALVDARLVGAFLVDANLTQVPLSGADLTGATLDNARLNYAYFAKANLTEASLRGARLNHAQLDDATLTNVNLGPDPRAEVDRLAGKRESRYLLNADLTGASWPSQTPLPEGWVRDGVGWLKRSDNARVSQAEGAG